MQKGNPLSADILTNLFRTSPKDPLRIINREGSTIEFKESYSHATAFIGLERKKSISV